MLEALLILTGFLTILVHVIDRSCNWESNVFAMTLWMAVVQLLLILPFVGLVGPISWLPAAVIFLVAIFSAYARSRWFLALSTSGGSISRLVPITRISSFLVLILAFVLLGERLSLLSLTGGIIMIVGALVITLERPAETWKQFIAANIAVILVLAMACSRAVNNVASKWILDTSDMSFFSLYFYLKAFELLATLLMVLASRDLRSRFSHISNPQGFVAARGLQTFAGLIFIFVLKNMDLSRAEPITAAGPLIAIVWEWADRKLRLVERAGGKPPPEKELSRTAWVLRLIGVVLIVCGFILLQRGK